MKSKVTGLFSILLLYFHVAAQDNAPRQIISQHKSVFNTPPSRTPGNVAVDGPLLGNGYCAAAISGPPEKQTYYLARNDFWRLKSGFNESFPAVLGRLQINIPSLQTAAYKIEQNLYDAVTLSSFVKGDTQVAIRSWMTAAKDWLVIEIRNTGSASVTGNAQLELPGNDQFHVKPPLENKFLDSTSHGISKHGIEWIERGFVKDVDIRTMAAAACKIIGRGTNTFSIHPAESITIVCAMSGNFRGSKPALCVQKELEMCSEQSVSGAMQAHLKWWHDYWQESYVSISDTIIEKQYYRSQYVIASCSRDPKFPPGIFGSWTTKEMPAWNGDYHLNYNYIAPFYALYSSNHLRQAIPFEAPVLDFMKRGKYYSAKITRIPDGVLYPVGIGPLGIETTRRNGIMDKYMHGYISGGQVEDEGLFFGQKSNAAYCAVNFSQAFYRTYDQQFARRVYPLIKAVAVFWQHYVKKEGDRYVIGNDAIHEGTTGNKNPILSLGLVRMVLQTAVDMSQILGQDAALKTKWKNIRDSLSTFPLQTRNGKTVFRYSEEGPAWWPDNTLGIQHIYPAGQIGLDSDTALLQASVNTINEMHRWQDFNGSNSFFPAAVRIGYDADSILKALRRYSQHTYPNGFQYGNPHGIENCSTVPNTINEMLCMSNQQVLRVFKVWPPDADASFANLRSEGAFLISSALRQGKVQYVKIVSEQGRPLTLENPWPGSPLLITSNKKPKWETAGGRVTLSTLKGEILMITPR